MRLRNLAIAAACLLPSAALAGKRPYTVADSIALADFVAPRLKYHQMTPRVMASPDGSQHLAVTVRGDVASGRRVASLLVFDAVQVRKAFAAKAQAPAPRLAATWASASNVEPVSDWRWSSDGRHLLFIGADDQGVRGLLRVDLASGAQTRLTPQTQDVAGYDERNGRIVYLAQAPMPEDEINRASGPDLPDTVIGTGKSILQMIFPHALGQMLQDARTEVWTLERDGAARAVRDPATGAAVRLQQARLQLSPDGTQLLTTVFAKHVPKAWERYRPLRIYPGLDFVADPPGVEPQASLYRPRQYAVIDLATGAQRLLADAPIETEVQFRDAWAAWSPDSAAVAVAGLYPPLPVAGADRVLPCEVAVVTVATAAVACVRPAKALEGTGFIKQRTVADLAMSGADEVRVSIASASAPDRVEAVRYRRAGAGWSMATVSAKATDMSLRVVESLRQAPLIVARVGADERTIYDPNPQLADIAMATVEDYRWRTPDGVEWSGALVKPPEFKPGVRAPLVVQTHNLDRTRFLADGPSAAGFAARPLAARGILVLQVDEPGTGAGTPKESPAGAAGYRAAIAQLAAEGLVDPKRVGITTWSHMGPYAMQGLVEDPGQYAAAIFADAAYNGYGEYLMNIDYLGSNREAMFRAQVGPKPFGSGLDVWVKTSAGFQTDRVCAPMFWQIYGASTMIYAWSSYAALRAQDKPVDLLYFRTADHSLLKPPQRVVGQGMSVDWYDYWLNGHKDPAPEKAAQYARWDMLKPGEACRVPTARAPAPASSR